MPLYRYFDDEKWAEEFLDGKVRFCSLSCYHEIEDEETRGDVNEGVAITEPPGGTTLNILNRNESLPFRNLQSYAKASEILIYCLSGNLSKVHWERFNARCCVQIKDVRTFEARILRALPVGAQIDGLPGLETLGHWVKYYGREEPIGPKWQVPGLNATSKLSAFSWQKEYRLMFSMTDAFRLGNVTLGLEGHDQHLPRPRAEKVYCEINAGSLRSICRVRRHPPNA